MLCCQTYHCWRDVPITFSCTCCVFYINYDGTRIRPVLVKFLPGTRGYGSARTDVTHRRTDRETDGRTDGTLYRVMPQGVGAS